MILLNPKGNVNLHTHTYYCDGKDSPEALVQRAIALGFRALGFSGHEYSSFDTDFCMSPTDTEKYRGEVLALKEKYKGQVDIYMGIERDYFGDGDDYPYDYVIGSLHYVKAGDRYLPCLLYTSNRPSYRTILRSIGIYIRKLSKSHQRAEKAEPEMCIRDRLWGLRVLW